MSASQPNLDQTTRSPDGAPLDYAAKAEQSAGQWPVSGMGIAPPRPLTYSPKPPRYRIVVTFEGDQAVNTHLLKDDEQIIAKDDLKAILQLDGYTVVNTKELNQLRTIQSLLKNLLGEVAP